MKNEIIDISYWNLIIALASIAFPLFLFWYYKIRIIKDVLISVVRMIVQLSLAYGIFYFLLYSRVLLRLALLILFSWDILLSWIIFLMRVILFPLPE